MSDPAAERSGNDWRQCWRVVVLAVCLLAPSFWMLATVPPLWRDVDAYKQLTQNPAKSAHVGHGLLYCLAVRVPLYAGRAVERLTQPARAPQPQTAESTLTDTGILFLVVAQHLALAAAALLLVMQAAERFAVRLGLVIFFALNPVFYTFAHCVSSEALSMILLLVVAALGLRVVRCAGQGAITPWVLYAVALFAAVTTRHANMLFAFLLPAAMLFPLHPPGRFRTWRLVLLALAVSLASVAAARLATSAFCRTQKLPYYSRAGATFLWRLPFVNRLPEAERGPMFERVAAKARTDDARRVLLLWRDLAASGTPLGPNTALEPARELLAIPGTTKGQAQRVHFALNEAARAFLFPPAPELWTAAKEDFATAGRIRLSQVTQFLFGTTAFFFDNQDAMPEAAGLRTFREYTRSDLLTIPQRSAYLRWWDFFAVKHCLIAWAVTALGLMFLGWRTGERSVVMIAVYGTALVALGALAVAFTCMIGELLPRYTLPVWATAWIALILALGVSGDWLGRGKASRQVG